MGRWILAIDLGNGGPKVAVVDLHDQLLAVSVRAVSVKIGLDGTATQDANEWWKETLQGAREAIVTSNVNPQDMHAVAITGQWGSTVPVDSKGIPVGEVLLWSDTRGERYMREIIGGPISYQGFAPHRVIPWIRKTGGGPTPSGADPTGHSMVLQREMKATHDRASFLLEPIDYLGMRFTGNAGATPASMILSWITDNRIGKPMQYDAGLVRKAHRDPAKLPPLLSTGSILGTILPDVAESLGVPTNVPVICGIPDLHSAVIGSGAVEPFDTHVTISTTAWIGARVPFKKTDILHSIASVPGLDKNYPVVANNHETGGSALRWLIENVFTGEGYEGALARAQTAPAGSEGVIFTPWLNGERSPIDDKKVRASFLNMSLRTDESMMIRAVMEGVAFNSRWLFDSYEKFLGRKPATVRIIGGGAQSDLWCQMHAYALNRPVERPANPRDAQLKGAASWARICLGEISLREAGDQTKVADTFLPDGPDAKIYADLYQEYRGLYTVLKKTHHRLGKITN